MQSILLISYVEDNYTYYECVVFKLRYFDFMKTFDILTTERLLHFPLV